MVSSRHEGSRTDLLGNGRVAELGVPETVGEVDDDTSSEPSQEVEDTRNLFLRQNEDVDEHSGERDERDEGADEGFRDGLRPEGVEANEWNERKWNENDVEISAHGSTVQDGEDKRYETPEEDLEDEESGGNFRDFLEERESSPDDAVASVGVRPNSGSSCLVWRESEHNNATAHHGERQQRSNRNHIAEDVQVEESSEYGCKYCSNDGCNVRSLALVQLEHKLEEQTVGGHLVENSGLAHERSQRGRSECSNGANRDDVRCPRCTDRVERDGERGIAINFRQRNHASQHHDCRDVQGRRNQQGTHDSNRHIALWVLHLTCQGSYRVESNVREKYLSCAYEHVSKSEGSKWLPVSSIYVDRSKHDHEEDDSNIENCHDYVKRRRLPCSDEQHGCA